VPEQRKRPLGRPRIWASEAERKRAYRARRAAELAEPHRVRDEAQAARAEATAAKSQLQTATRALQRAEQGLLAAERRAAKLLERIQATDANLKRARMARDRAEQLLRQKLSTVKDAQHLRDDPDALLAVIAEQRQLLAWYRTRLAAVERTLRALGGSPPSRGNP
jgi:chromosome segregation ATPase